MSKLRLKRNNKPVKIIRKQQKTNVRDFQKSMIEVLQLPQTQKKTEIQNKRKTLDVGYVTKVIRFPLSNFKKFVSTRKTQTVKCKGLCFNCLSNTHQIGNSRSKVSFKLKACGKRHNTISQC